MLLSDLFDEGFEASGKGCIFLAIEAEIKDGYIIAVGADSHCLCADDGRGHTGKRHYVDDTAEALVMILNGLSDAENGLTFKRMVQVWLRQFDNMLDRAFCQRSEPRPSEGLGESFFERLGKFLFNFVLEIILYDVCEPICKLGSASGHFASCEICIVNPLCE